LRATSTALLTVVAEGMQRFYAQLLAHCLIGNHYHFRCTLTL
jgi:hypothetical protein